MRRLEENGKPYLNEDKTKQFKEITENVIKFINDNCHPHIKIIIDCNSVELVEGVTCHVTDKYILD